MTKQRLDQLLVEQGYYESRERARTAIMSNYVTVAGQVQNKAGAQISLKKLEEDPNYIQVNDKTMPYVSRGAFKLEKAKEEFQINFENKIVLDLGASTGGFTDYALQHGAKKVFAIDVGRGQLDYKLQNNSKVQNLEAKNVKELQVSELDLLMDDSARNYLEKIDIVVADLSFISITKILDNLKKLIKENYGDEEIQTQFVFLIKPQFEAGKKIADKFRGIITDDQVRQEILDEVLEKIKAEAFVQKGLVESPIKGAKGNIEFLAYFTL